LHFSISDNTVRKVKRQLSDRNRVGSGRIHDDDAMGLCCFQINVI
jgi:hypothetical protein